MLEARLASGHCEWPLRVPAPLLCTQLYTAFSKRACILCESKVKLALFAFAYDNGAPTVSLIQFKNKMVLLQTLGCATIPSCIE